uniref:Ig-like domain-containing protein n=1 Tax=Chelonoidis abingdonii TaxID=106734 RepID=A0A8C0FZD9_CHEAB
MSHQDSWVLSLALGGEQGLLPGFTLTVPQSVSVQEGLCVLIPCTFTYSASSNTYSSWPQLYRYWYKDQASVVWNPPVASSESSREVSQETRGRFQLAKNPAHGDCSLQISDARRTDAGKYFFRFKKGTLMYNYLSNSYGTDAKLAISVSALSFTPGPGDHGKELVCTISYRPPWGPSTRRTVQLHVVWPAPLGTEGDVVSLETQEDDSLSLSCDAGSRPEATLSWARMNRSLSPGQEGTRRLELPNLRIGDAGEYRCWAKNSYGSASRALRVHVQSKALGGAVLQGSGQGFNPSTLVANGSQLSAREGDSLRFLCSVASSPPAALGWVRGGRAIKGTRPAGENQLQLELPNVTDEDGGLYGCWAQNKQSSAQGTFQLQVEYSPRLGTRLNSSCQHQGPSISCSCSLRSHPPPQLQWQVDGVSLAGNSSWGALQVHLWAQGDETISTLSWMGSEERGSQIFCLGFNRHGSYAALHFELSVPQRGETLGLLGSVPRLGRGVRGWEPGLLGSVPAVPQMHLQGGWGKRDLGQPMQSTQQGGCKSLPGVSALLLTQDHKTPAAHWTKGIQDGAAAAQAPLGPGKPDELHYASINFSKLQCKGVEPPEAPDKEYSEVRLK